MEEEGEEESEEEEEEEEAEPVEVSFHRIVSERRRDGKLQFRLAWHGTHDHLTRTLRNA